MLRRAAVRSLVVLGVFCPLGLNAQQTCGGTERWQVKVGTDSGAGSVQLQPIQITLQDIIKLQEPQLPPQADNDTRLPEETHVYQFQGHLVQFKQEAGSTGDSDYHLVIADDTLQFTKGGAGNPNPGHSLIAEIPDPNCIPGKHGDPDVPSRFLAAITCARGKMDVKFPDADKTGQFNDTGGIAVTITGVGFFDRSHGQTGRALNDLEIHPILDIDFGDGQASCFQAPSPDLNAAGAPKPASPAAARAGAKWEYKAIAATTADDLASQAGALSAQRWEMVGVAFDARTKSYVGFLKRAATP